MSDSFQYIMLPGVARDATASSKESVLNALWSAGIVQRERDLENVSTLGDSEAYRPSHALIEHFSDSAAAQGNLLDLITNGMEVIEGFGFDGAEINEVEEVVCPGCGVLPVEEMIESIIEAADQFYETGEIPNIECPCGTKVRATALRATPELSFTHLGFKFWNWPVFENVQGQASTQWLIDIPGLIANAASQDVRLSWGQI